MSEKDNSNTERIGIPAIDLIFRKDFGWIFREQTVDDYGIDAHVEIKDNKQATGRLIGLQIKTGKSWFKQKNEKGYVYYVSEKHRDYWLNHSLPVLIVFVRPRKRKSFLGISH